jgi:protein-disulfide isomerase
VEVAIDPAELSRVQGISIGREDAPVVIYEFADFQCPACGQYASFVTPLIKERLVEPGLVRYVYYDFPLVRAHPHAFLAARAGRCANEQGKFWGYHDLVYARQPTWSALSDATDFFVDLAREAGLDEERFEACLRSDRYAEEVTRSLRLGESLGVQGTPTLFVNGKRLPNPPTFEELEQIVRQEAGVASAATPPAM